MKQNTAYFNNQKMSKIIALSINYKKHRQLLSNSKPVVDFSDVKHIERLQKLSIQKQRYRNNARNQKNSEIKQENAGITKRILQAKSAIKRTINQTINTLKQTPKESRIKRTSSNTSFRSVSSQKSCSSNFRRRTIRQNQIDFQNRKLAERIMKPKRSIDVSYQKIKDFYEKQQRYNKIRSRFSDRSQSILQSLALDTLKIQKKYFQFLPQLSFKKHPAGSNKFKLAREYKQQQNLRSIHKLDPQI